MRPSATLLLAALLALPAARAQTPGSCALGTASGTLDASDVVAYLPNTGALFFGTGLVAAYEVPAGTGRSPIYAASLWVGGTVGGQVRTAAAQYASFEFWPGPLDAGAALPNPTDCTAYDRVWVVSTANVAAYEAGGSPTPDLAQWPVGLGAPAVDAGGTPIVTTDRTRVLDLAAGERPVIYGSQTAFWVMNDVGNTHAYTGSTPLGVEVQVAAFAVASPEAALDQATFYRYRLVNRNTQPILGARAGFYVDADLGDASDDYVGSDTTRGLLFFYNADNADGDGTPPSYGTPPPAVGLDFLSGQGAETWLAKSCAQAYCEGHMGAPTTESYRLLQGLWRDGTPITEGGNGYNTGGPVVSSSFPGAPETSAYWSMRCSVLPGCTPFFAGDHRGLISAAAFDLAPGAAHDVTLAVVFAQGTSNLDSVARLRAASDRVQAAYADGSLFDSVPVAGEPGPARRDGFTLQAPAPNPAAGATEVAYEVGAAGPVRLAVYDVLGREVAVLAEGTQGAGPHRAALDARGLAPGAYVVVLEAAGVRLTQRLALAR